MMTFTFTEEEVATILYALNDRTTRMFRDAEAYKRNENKEAMKDCLREMDKANCLSKLINKTIAQ